MIIPSLEPKNNFGQVCVLHIQVTAYRVKLGKKYMPRNSSPFEVYLNNPDDEKDHLIKVNIYVPLEE